MSGLSVLLRAAGSAVRELPLRQAATLACRLATSSNPIVETKDGYHPRNTPILLRLSRKAFEREKDQCEAGLLLHGSVLDQPKIFYKLCLSNTKQVNAAAKILASGLPATTPDSDTLVPINPNTALKADFLAKAFFGDSHIRSMHLLGKLSHDWKNSLSHTLGVQHIIFINNRVTFVYKGVTFVYKDCLR